MAPANRPRITTDYDELLHGIVALLEEGRRSSAHLVNASLATTYWLVGEQLVEYEQGGAERAVSGAELLLKRLARDLASRLGRGFSERNLQQMRQFYLDRPNPDTRSRDSSASPGTIESSQTLSAKSLPAFQSAFPLSWSHYVRLLSVPDPAAKRYYEIEALRGGWSVRQLDGQIATLAYERSRTAPGNSAAM